MSDSVDVALGAFSIQESVRGQIEPTADDDLKPPKNIISTLLGARSVFFKMRAEHLKRISLYSAIHGLIAGNPPYDPAELDKHGLGYAANFNDMSARSKVEKAAEALWNLVNEVENLMTFEITYDDQELNNSPYLERYQEILAKEADRIVRRWPSFVKVQNIMALQLIELGISPVFWSNPYDWRYRTVELSRFYLPDQALTDLDKLTFWAIESFFDVQYLFQVYQHEKEQKESPWNLNELRHLLLRQANTYYKSQGLPYNEMDMQRKLENGDILYESAFTDMIRLVSLFYKEYDGKFTHMMFHQTIGQSELLFKEDRLYSEVNEAMVLFTYSPGEFTIHGNRGLGHKIFALAQAANQMHCSMVDAGRLAATVFMRSSPLQGHDATPLRLYPGGVSHIGTSEVVETQIGENVDQLVGLAQYFEGLQEKNLMNAGDDPAAPDADKGSVSASQARMMALKEFGTLRSVVNHYYDSQDAIYRNVINIWLRALQGKNITWEAYKSALKWKKRCVAQGVPEEIFEWDDKENEPRHLFVEATRVAGDGSTLGRIMGLEAMQSIVGALDQDGVYEWERQWIMATNGRRHVRAFLKSKEDMQASTGGNSVAGTENAIMQEPLCKSPVLALGDDHTAHLQTHIALAQQVFQGLSQQQTTPLEADKVLTVLTPHIQEHYQVALRNPFLKSFCDKVKLYVGQIIKETELNKSNAAKQLQAAIRQQQQDQQATEQVMNEEQRKNMKAQGDESRANFKIQSQVQRADEANRTRAEVMRDKVQRDAENQRLKIQLTAGAAKQDLQTMQGKTPAPYDVEKVVPAPIPTFPRKPQPL